MEGRRGGLLAQMGFPWVPSWEGIDGARRGMMSKDQYRQIGVVSPSGIALF